MVYCNIWPVTFIINFDKSNPGTYNNETGIVGTGIWPTYRSDTELAGKSYSVRVLIMMGPVPPRVTSY